MPSGWFRKEGILPVVLGLAVLGAASYFLLFAPELRTIRSLRAELAAKEAEVAEAMKLRSEVTRSRVGDGAEWEERLRMWERRVPSARDDEHLLAEIGDMAVRHDLKSFGLTSPAGPGGAAPEPAESAAGSPPRGSEGFAEARFRITFRSTYRDLAEFLGEIPRMRRLVTIRSVSVKERADAMTAEIELSAWHRRGR